MTGTLHSTAQERQITARSPDGLSSFANPFFEVQRAQWEAWQTWSRSLATFNKDFWEQWAVRYAGGMPFDG